MFVLPPGSRASMASTMRGHSATGVGGSRGRALSPYVTMAIVSSGAQAAHEQGE